MSMVGICILIILILIQTPSNAHQNLKNSSCKPSVCGNTIQNISYPFRLKDDPESCGHPHPRYEITCQNNTTASVYIDNLTYHVRAIEYRNFTIRLADPSIKHNDSCSFPTHSPDWDKLIIAYSSPYINRLNTYQLPFQSIMIFNITFLSCPFPDNRTLFLETSQCLNTTINMHRHAYIKAGDFDESDLGEMCSIDMAGMTSLPLDAENVSLSKIHDSLVYGFELSWYDDELCEPCSAEERCSFDGIAVTCTPAVTRCDDSRHMLKGLGEDVYRRMAGVLYFIYGGLNQFAEIWHRDNIFGYRGCLDWPLTLYYDMVVGMIVIIVYLAVICLVLRFFIGMLFYIVLIIYKRRRLHLSMFDLIEGFLQSHSNLMPIRYSYTEIKKMTRGFREKLGQGGFGSVYKGKLRSGNIVAVKVLGMSNTNGQDFINEVATMGRIHHVNVIKLVGYCVERSRCALVYDFMPNGSLEKYIYSEKSENSSLSWGRKFEIAVGVARGIEYLHRGCDIQILHFDIKPHNILLDENFNPKISDFGLAKFYSTEKNIVTLTAARGTVGYVAPELINRSIGGVSYKADVYSFGMLLVEMVGLKRGLTANEDKSTQYFPHWIYDCLNKGKDLEIAKTGDDIDNDNAGRITRRMTIVALWCIQLSPNDRPSMGKVLEMLESDAELLQIPPQRFEFDERVAPCEDLTRESYATSDYTASSLCEGPTLSQDL